MTDYKPGTYVKGAIARVANTKADAVSLVFDGFKLSEDSEQEAVEAHAERPAPDFPEPESLVDDEEAQW